MLIKLPFPDARLSPNRKNGKHWSSTNAIKKAAFECAYYLTREAMALQKEKLIPTQLEIIFIEPDKRRRDMDNMLASIKAYIDGLSLALGVDDYTFAPITIDRDYAKGAGAVYITIKPSVN